MVITYQKPPGQPLPQHCNITILMKNDNTFASLFLLLLLWGNTVFATAESSVQEQQALRQSLEVYLLSKYEQVKLTQILSQQDHPKARLEKALGLDFSLDTQEVLANHYYFSDISNTKSLGVHLGVFVVRYHDESAAKKALNKVEQEGFFAGTKILTRYRIINKRNHILSYLRNLPPIAMCLNLSKNTVKFPFQYRALLDPSYRARYTLPTC